MIEQALALALKTFEEQYPGDVFTHTHTAGQITVRKSGEHFLTCFFPSHFAPTLLDRYGAEEAPIVLASYIVDSRSED